MKAIKFIFATMVCSALVVGLCACSKDDDETGNEMSKPTWVLTQMNSETFQYDGEGHMVQIDGCEDWCSSLNYEDGKIIGKKVTFFLNKDLITEFNADGDITSFKYNYDNCLVEWGWFSNNEEDDEVISLSWENDLIEHYRHGCLGSYNKEHLFSYYNESMINSDCIRILNAFVISKIIDGEYPWVLGMQGYLGKLPIMPIHKIETCDIKNYPPNGDCEITYSYIDNNGCPAKVSINGDEYNLSWKKL